MTKQLIEANPFYQQILSDSFGGVIYNVANQHKYDEGKQTLLKLWDDMTESQKSAAGGIMKGAMNFLREGE